MTEMSKDNAEELANKAREYLAEALEHLEELREGGFDVSVFDPNCANHTIRVNFGTGLDVSAARSVNYTEEV